MDKDDISHTAFIDLIFENCDYLSIPYKYIGDFQLLDVKDDYLRFANGISKSKAADHFYIEISKEFNTPDNISEMEQTVADNDDSYHALLPFERIKEFPDITHVQFHYEDGSESEEISVPWGNEEDTNTNQTFKLTDNGDLYICISEKYKANDFVEEKNGNGQ